MGLEAILSLVSAVLLILLAGARILGAIATLLLAVFSFALWCIASWQVWLDQCLSFVAGLQQTIKEL